MCGTLVDLGGRRLGRFLQNRMGVGSTETECAHPGTQWAVGLPLAEFHGDLDRQSIPGDVRVGVTEVQMGRYLPPPQGKHHLQQARQTGRRLAMPRFVLTEPTNNGRSAA